MIPELNHYEHAAPTQVQLDWVDLPTVDLSLAATREGREELARTLRAAMQEHGFFSVINHGLTPEEARRMFDIADVPFSQVAEDVKVQYVADIKGTGSYEGYKLRQYWHISGGVRDQIEHYNVNRDVEKREHPPALQPFLPEIARFARFNHERVLHALLRLFARGMGLPEETFVDMHKFDAVGETSGNYPREDGDEEKTKSVWLKGHTDIGTVTILWSQPVSALQILAKDGTWRWVRHVPNGLVINAGDALEFLSGGFYKATIHRVVQPPEDQRKQTRLGLFYFCSTDDNVRLEPLVANPEYEKRFEVAPTMEQWRKGVTRAYGRTKLIKQDESGRIEKETIAGVLVRHFN
ncbi:Clavaminate synthase-like protein [Auricularia subglabra TFB-10046 SS5]|uniref:Clavaminate synthase-like protein n=1 Tax=Auricularia subglabra (strain TFB-10046 / SS5) TaxID=717982 RepID=J0CXB5_AURST|nr:Clavaminate synthase-like protein [Auricularia subglabra TFB-10046 SS5]